LVYRSAIQKQVAYLVYAKTEYGHTQCDVRYTMAEFVSANRVEAMYTVLHHT